MDAYQDRNTAVYLAKLGVEAERYDEAKEAMKSVALMGVELTRVERNLIQAAYKSATELRRASWRELSAVEKMEESKGNGVNVERVKEYMRKVETEITDICADIQSILDHHVIPLCSSAEDRVFYYKMKADSYRYCAELKNGEEREALAQQALEKYDEATKIAEQELHVIDPIRLALALNFSVCHYEICGGNSLKIGREIAQRAHDEALPVLDSIATAGGDWEAQDQSYRILRILKDNLSHWAAAERDANI